MKQQTCLTPFPPSENGEIVSGRIERVMQTVGKQLFMYLAMLFRADLINSSNVLLCFLNYTFYLCVVVTGSVFFFSILVSNLVIPVVPGDPIEL